MPNDLVDIKEQINTMSNEYVTPLMLENAWHCAKLLVDLGLQVSANYYCSPSNIQVRGETEKGYITLTVNEEAIEYDWHSYIYFKGRGYHNLIGLHVEQLPSIVTYGAKKLSD